MAQATEEELNEQQGGDAQTSEPGQQGQDDDPKKKRMQGQQQIYQDEEDPKDTPKEDATEGGDNDDNDGDKLPPKVDVTLSLRGIPEFDQYPFGMSKDRFYFMASIKAPFFRTEERAPIDLVAVVDESGSMSGDRITLVKETVGFIIKNLESEDCFGLVGYSNASRIILPLSKMDSAGKQKATVLATKLQAAGGTALCAGLVAGVNMMRQRNAKNDVASVMILTDGQANVGPKSAADIMREVTRSKGNKIKAYVTPSPPSPPKYQQKMNKNKKTMKRKVMNKKPPMIQQQQQQAPTQLNDEQKQDEGIVVDMGSNELPCTINTFGFGTGHNESLLEAIAENGRGMYAFIENTDGIADTFAECLGGLVSIIGQELKIKVEALNEVKINKCLSKGYALKVEKPSKVYGVTIDNIQSEENRDLVFELTMPVAKAPKEKDPIIQISVTYKNVVKNQTDILSSVVCVDRVESKEEGERNIELDIQYNRVLAAEAMEQADELANKGKLDEARKVLNTAQTKISKSRSNKDAYSQNLVKDIQLVNDNMKSKQQYKAKGGKMLKMNKKAHYMQRSVQSSNYASQSVYENKSKKSMKRKFKSHK